MTSTITNDIPKVLQPVIQWPVVDTAHQQTLSLWDVAEFLEAMEKELDLIDGHNHYRFREVNRHVSDNTHHNVRVTFGMHFVVVCCGNHLAMYRPHDCSEPPFGYEALGV